MILQALAGYYERLLGDGAVQPQGFQEKEIPWVVELSHDGRYFRLIRTGGEDGRGRKFIVPAEVKKSVNIAANLLWDNPEYVFGWPRPGLTEKQAAKVPERHEAFMARLHALPETARADARVSAVIKFLEEGDFAALQSAEGYDELRRGNPNLSFRLDGDDHLVCERPAVRDVVSQSTSEPTETESDGWCLITGRRAGPARLHPSIKGVRGALSRGADLVSFNLDAFTSHGWRQGANAPISEPATHAYTAALNHLLARDNERHHLIEGDTTFVFWAAAQNPIEDQFAYLLGSYSTNDDKSDPTRVRETFESVKKGSVLSENLENPTPFYVLGLAPNAARLAVRLWHEGTVAELAHNILRHFNDLEIVGLGSESNVPGLWRLIGAAARDGDLKKLSDTLRGQLAAGVMTAVLQGQPYPATLLARASARCRAEARRKPERDSFRLMLPIRAALIKASLKRRSPTKEVSVSLDPDEPDAAYRLGRLFWVLEDIQRQAAQSNDHDDTRSERTQLNVTIRDRYFGAFMTAPRSVFPQLMHLKNAHLKKINRRNSRRARNFEYRIDDILAPLRPRELPAALLLEEQGRFVLGYHHQRNSWRDHAGGRLEAEPDDLSEPEITEQGD